MTSEEMKVGPDSEAKGMTSRGYFDKIIAPRTPLKRALIVEDSGSAVEKGLNCGVPNST